MSGGRRRPDHPGRPRHRIAASKPTSASSKSIVRSVKTRRGVRLTQHGVVLSEVLRQPGPTHSVADVIGAAIHCLAPGPQVVVLGFAGGGLLAPLRGLQNRAAVEGVDLDRNGHRLFQRLCAKWAGDVRFWRADAVKWLVKRHTAADVIVDDLSVPEGRDVIKPAVSWVEIPGLIRNRLRRNGVAILNWLPPERKSWRAATRVVGALFPTVHVVLLDDFENRILVCGRQLPSASALARALARSLRTIGSRQAGRIAVRTWPM